MKTNEFSINCVDMVRKIRDKNYQVTKNMSKAQKIKYIREKAEAVHKKLHVISN